MRGLWIACLFALPAAAGEGEVIAHLEWEPSFVGTNKLRAYPLAASAPAGVKAPKEAAGARFATISLGKDVRVYVAVDEERLWVDSDLDGDLDEEAPRTWKDGNATDTVLVPLEGENEPLPVVLSFYRGTKTIKLSVRIHRRGVALLADRLRPIALVDGNGDLRFNDPVHDRLYVDIDGDGRFEGAAGSHEQVGINKPFHVAGRGYVASVPDPLGRTVVFSGAHPIPPPLERWTINRLEIEPVGADVRPPKGTFSQLSAAYVTDPVGTVRAVSQLGTKVAFEFLEQACRTHKDTLVRQWAIHEMRYRPYLAFAARIKKLVLSHEDPDVRRTGVQALHVLDAPGRARTYAALLKKTGLTPSLAKSAAQHLAYLGVKHVKTLRAASDAQSHWEVQYEIYRATVYTLPEPPRALLYHGLKAGGNRAREALRLLWKLRDTKRVRAYSLKLLTGGNDISSLFELAVTILAADGDEEAVRQILRFLSQRKSAKIRSKVVRAIRPIRSVGGIRALQRGLKSSSARTRRACADVLGSIPHSGAAPGLADAARKEQDPLIRDRMIRSLGDLADRRAIPLLMKFAASTDMGTRAAAVAALAHIGFLHPKVGPFLRKLLGASRWEDRVLATDAAGRAGDASLLEPLHTNLAHDVWQVRAAAADALGRLRQRDSIERLIAQLAREKARRVTGAIVEALFRMTGQEFFTADEWRQWWDKNKAGFRIRKKVPEHAPAKAGTTATFYGVPVRTDRVCFVLDGSGSMASVDAKSKGKLTRFDVAKSELLTAVSRLSNKARVNVILFADEWKRWRKSAVPLTAASRQSLKQFVSRNDPYGHTNIYDSLTAAFEDRNIDTIFLLSDGAPDRGYYRATENILRGVERLNQVRRVAIHTIAVGLDSELMRRLAENNGGRYVRR